MQDLAWSLVTTQPRPIASDTPSFGAVESTSEDSSHAVSSAVDSSPWVVPSDEMVSTDELAGDSSPGVPQIPPPMWASPGGPTPRVPRDRSNDAPVAAWIALALVGFGVLAEWTVRTSPQGLLGAVLGIVAVVIARVAAGRRLAVDAQTRWTRNAAAIIGVGASLSLVWRSNTTLRVLDYFTILISVALVSDVWLRATALVVRRVVRVMVAPLGGIFTAVSLAGESVGRRSKSRFGSSGAGIAESVKQRSGLFLSVGVGVVLAVPVVAVFGLLLASADAVFASFFQVPDFDLSGVGPAFVTVFRVGVFALLLAAPIVAGAAHRPEKVSDPKEVRVVGRVEALVVFAAVDALFALFCIAQLVSLGGGAKRVLTTSGLTYAEYARSGFFQLVAVAILTLMVLGGVRAAIGEEEASQRSVRLLSVLTALLTLAITFVAMQRMSLYIRTYGLTVDRIVAQAGTITIGCIFVLVLVGIVASRPGRDLRGATTAGALGVAALAIAILHVINPSAWSMRDGLRRSNVVTASTAGIVWDAPRGSSEIAMDNDSLPVVADWLRTNTTGNVSKMLRDAICSTTPEDRAWFQWEWSNMIADQHRSELCNVSR